MNVTPGIERLAREFHALVAFNCARKDEDWIAKSQLLDHLRTNGQRLYRARAYAERMGWIAHETECAFCFKRSAGGNVEGKFSCPHCKRNLVGNRCRVFYRVVTPPLLTGGSFLPPVGTPTYVTPSLRTTQTRVNPVATIPDYFVIGACRLFERNGETWVMGRVVSDVKGDTGIEAEGASWDMSVFDALEDLEAEAASSAESCKAPAPEPAERESDEETPSAQDEEDEHDPYADPSIKPGCDCGCGGDSLCPDSVSPSPVDEEDRPSDWIEMPKDRHEGLPRLMHLSKWVSVVYSHPTKQHRRRILRALFRAMFGETAPYDYRLEGAYIKALGGNFELVIRLILESAWMAEKGLADPQRALLGVAHQKRKEGWFGLKPILRWKKGKEPEITITPAPDADAIWAETKARKAAAQPILEAPTKLEKPQSEMTAEEVGALKAQAKAMVARLRGLAPTHPA